MRKFIVTRNVRINEHRTESMRLPIFAVSGTDAGRQADIAKNTIEANLGLVEPVRVTARLTYQPFAGLSL